ncbi:hypothetical protein M9Y10_040229 [Tritrichomonas musculus]|uniref:Uncharacterized protein n=1 Tax=Tritrichomonas musculus TaxID=1915356 RepID=A0ABR2GQ13_9EUKA
MQNEVVQRNMEKAIHYLKRASDLNVTLAQKGLGYIYYHAYYVTRDINKAIHYFLLAVKKEEPMSQIYLGKIYFYGDNIPRDLKKGLLYIELAAKNKSREAQLFHGHIYLEGKYVDRDILKPFNLYKEVSSFYNNFAKNNLGVIYKHGHKEINKNIPLSKEYFMGAIKQMNDPVSMYNLANIWLDEAEPDDDCQNSLEVLVRSTSQRLLCLVLMR